MSAKPRHQRPRSAIMAGLLFGATITLIGAVVIWLRMSPPPAARGGPAQTIAADDLRVTMQLDSAAMGERSIEVRIDDANGQPVAVDTVLLRFSMTDMDMGVTDVEAEPVGRGRYRARGAFFSMAGRWAVEAVVAREAHGPLAVTFTFPIAAPGEVAGPVNPLTADAATLAGGRQLYQTNCAVCHGAAGRGDGPGAAGLRPAPGDLTVHMAPGKHAEGQIYAWIRDGVPGSAMPAWGERLSDEEVWQLVAYLQTFAPAAAPASQDAAAQGTTIAPTPIPATAVSIVMTAMSLLLYSFTQNSRRTWAAILGCRVRVKMPFIFRPPTLAMLCTAAKSAKFQTCMPAT
jgi:mono/diheme cytochrome c family protein